MSLAIDTNVIVRLLVRDDEKQYASAKRFIQKASAAGEPILIVLMAILKTEWVLRSRYQLDKASIAQAFTQLLESQDVTIENAAALEEALYVWAQHPNADFTDCLLTARAAHLGATKFMTFDVGASKLPSPALMSSGQRCVKSKAFVFFACCGKPETEDVIPASHKYKPAATFESLRCTV